VSLRTGVGDLTALRFHWGMAYDIRQADGQWVAVSKRDETRLEEPSPEMLHFAIRQHYFSRPK
jgi:hypothetical protein